ncbi:MAG TPA: hypothetical protein VJP77_00195 [Planctomycetota bacterium]|nr:hypothetical protein [Planctomycetota bacterium]
MSVLFCTLGVLVFVISAMSLVLLDEPLDQVLHVAAAGEDLEPLFVECQEGGLVVHPDGDVVPVAGDALIPGPELDAFLDGLEQLAQTRYCVLLVRPSGIATYDAALRAIRNRGLRVGKDALLEGGEVFVRTQERRL